MPERILDHAPRPGPQYWDWRCLVCSEPMNRHGGLLARWLWRRSVRLVVVDDDGRARNE